jgi:hypothetical protein
MVWETNYKKYPSLSSERCLQRMIAMTNEMDTFLHELIRGGSENLYSCVGETFPDILEGRVGECFRAHTSKRQNLAHISRSLMRSLHECDKERYWCTCNTRSSCVYRLDWKVPF